MALPLRKLPDLRLTDFPFFTSLGAQAVESLIRHLPTKHYKRGEHLIRQGEPGRTAYLLYDGKVSVNVEGRQGSHSVAFHAAPDIFGIIELWREHECLANVVAIEPCSALVLDRKDYLKMLHTNHQVCVNLNQFLSELLYQTGRDREVRVFGKVEHLLANTICYFAELYGEDHPYGMLVRRDINKSELATLLGISRRSVIRGLESLQKERLIHLEGKQLIVPDIKALKKKARSALHGF